LLQPVDRGVRRVNSCAKSMRSREMARVADATALHARFLNESKGRRAGAARARRQARLRECGARRTGRDAQSDVVTGMAEDLLLDGAAVAGWCWATADASGAERVLATGRFSAARRSVAMRCAPRAVRRGAGARALGNAGAAGLSARPAETGTPRGSTGRRSTSGDGGAAASGVPLAFSFGAPRGFAGRSSRAGLCLPTTIRTVLSGRTCTARRSTVSI